MICGIGDGGLPGPIPAQAPVAIAYAWVTTEFSLSMSLLAALTWLMACCARGDGSGCPRWRGEPGRAQRGEVVIKRSDVPARNRDGISGLVEVVLEAAVNVVLDGAGHVVVNRPADAITVAPGPWANGIKLMWGLASARRRSWSAASAGQSGRACG